MADTLLYDERCHLPRSAPRPEVVPEVVVSQSVPEAGMVQSTSAPVAPAAAASR